MALTGIDNPRPVGNRLPLLPYVSLTLQSNVPLSCWHIQATGRSKGTVILFHGYGGEKSSMLDKAYVALKAGYNVLLPDFMGAGSSGGNQTTIGFREAENVKTCFDYIHDVKHEQNIVLLGSSMGAVAIMKYLDQGYRQPSGVVLECPFGSMYKTVCTRFRMVHAPVFPMAGLLVFWGGIENGFSAFSHNPEDYARHIYCPALLSFGEKDDRVSREEIDAIYKNLAGPKTLKTYPEAGHNNSLALYPEEWINNLDTFLAQMQQAGK